jgi:hypothetical protein
VKAAVTGRTVEPVQGDAVEPGRTVRRANRLRNALLALVVLGAAGLAAELILLEHTETFAQWLPLAVLGVALAQAGWVAVRPGRVSLRLFQALMLGVLAVGVAGVVLHYRSNVEFELEMYPTLGGRALVWQSLKGAVPALAPGALAQLGLLGLVFTIGHPGLRAPDRGASGPSA